MSWVLMYFSLTVLLIDCLSIEAIKISFLWWSTFCCRLLMLDSIEGTIWLRISLSWSLKSVVFDGRGRVLGEIDQILRKT